MQDLPVARRYTQALYEAAADAGRLDAVAADLESIGQLLDSSPEFASFVGDPTLPEDRRRQGLDALFKGKVEDLTLRLLHLLVAKDRLAVLPGVVQTFGEQVDEAKGLLSVQVTTPVELTATQLKALTAKLEARTGKTIRATQDLDPSLIGGFRLRMGDVVEDHSLRAKLDLFKRKVVSA